MNPIERVHRLHMCSRIYGTIAWCAVVMGLTAIGLSAAEAHPAATAADWVADPAAAAAKAAEQAKHTANVISGITIAGIGIGILAALRYAAPLIPGLGPAWKAGADLVWSVIQHRDAKQADAAQARVASAASFAVAASREVRRLAPDTWNKLPNDLRVALEALQVAG